VKNGLFNLSSVHFKKSLESKITDYIKHRQFEHNITYFETQCIVIIIIIQNNLITIEL
jgi:hypothetical protein